MATNPYLSWNNLDEQNLYESLIVEALQFYGEDVYYIPRDIITKDDILNEAIESRFDDFIEIEMYLETVDAFEGDGEMFGRFGLELRNQIKLMVSKLRFEEEISNGISPTNTLIRPKEGDLIYHALTKGLYEIRYVDNETPSFYNLGNLPVFRLTCELFEYSGEDLDTGVVDIDGFTEKFTVDGLQITTSELYQKGTTLTITSFDSPELIATAELLEVDGNNCRIGLITYNTDIFTILSNMVITDGISSGTITNVYDNTSENASPTEPFDDSAHEGDNAEIEDFADTLIDNTNSDPLGDVT